VFLKPLGRRSGDRDCTWNGLCIVGVEGILELVGLHLRIPSTDFTTPKELDIVEFIACASKLRDATDIWCNLTMLHSRADTDQMLLFQAFIWSPNEATYSVMLLRIVAQFHFILSFQFFVIQ
jgi:hypothetical protein